MDIEKLKSDLRDQLSRGEYQVDRVLETLNLNESLLSAEHLNELLHVRSQWNNYQSKNRKNLFYPGESDVAYGRILDSLLGLISSLGSKVVLPEQGIEPDPKPKVKTILFLAANPEKSSFLRLDKEFRTITDSLRKSRWRDSFKLELRLATRASDLTQAVLEHKPWAIHFAGHGGMKAKQQDVEGRRGLKWQESHADDKNETGILLMDEHSDGIKYISIEALGNYFSFFKDSLELVFLNSCYSGVQAKAIGEHIPYVIGMGTAVADDLAIAFSRSFYEALFAGEKLALSFELAKASLDLADYKGTEIPQILSRS